MKASTSKKARSRAPKRTTMGMAKPTDPIGKKDGPHRERFKDGSVSCTGAFQDGKKTGLLQKGY